MKLNQALDINASQLLTQGWARVPAVRNAAQLSMLKPGPPSIVWPRRAITLLRRRILYFKSTWRKMRCPS
jgi:hypothetical protein